MSVQLQAHTAAQVNNLNQTSHQSQSFSQQSHLSSKESPTPRGRAAATCPVVEISTSRAPDECRTLQCAECRRGGRKASLSHMQHFGIHECQSRHSMHTCTSASGARADADL